MRFCLCTLAVWALSAPALSGAPVEEAPTRVTWTVRADRRTGRLIRSAVVKTSSTLRTDERLIRLVDETARKHDLDPRLVHSVIQVESNYNPFAISPKGARGLMQLMPATARRFGVADSFNLAENVQAGVRYLRYLFDMFGDERLALAAYNAGEEAVVRYGGVPPYAETQRYVRLVMGKHVEAGQVRLGGEDVVAERRDPPPPEYPPLERFVDSQGNICFRTR